jgi:uncharacterized protein
MIVVDVNLLIFASNEDSPHHDRARAWWQRTLSGDEAIGLPWSVILGFLRITTHRRALTRPLTPEQATEVIDGWFRQSTVRVLEPTSRHWSIVKELLAPLGTAGNLTMDAHLAALAIEHGGRLFSMDDDFDRFEGLRWVNPLAPAGRAQERSLTLGRKRTAARL